MSSKDTIQRLYQDYTKRFLGKIIISFFKGQFNVLQKKNE